MTDGKCDVQLDGRNRQAYDPDEVEEEQRERERRNKINVEFQRFTKRVQDHWDREMPRLNLEWDSPYRCAGCHDSMRFLACH
jgi:nucleosome binding factor SPN SPT16 subunit